MAACAAHGPSAFLFRPWKQKPWKELILAVLLGPSASSAFSRRGDGVNHAAILNDQRPPTPRLPLSRLQC